MTTTSPEGGWGRKLVVLGGMGALQCLGLVLCRVPGLARLSCQENAAQVGGCKGTMTNSSTPRFTARRQRMWAPAGAFCKMRWGWGCWQTEQVKLTLQVQSTEQFKSGDEGTHRQGHTQTCGRGHMQTVARAQKTSETYTTSERHTTSITRSAAHKTVR